MMRIDLGSASHKQLLFYCDLHKFVAFGGARGGGKSHAVRIKAILGALQFQGLRILIVRRTFPELENSVIDPILKLIPNNFASYNSSRHLLSFFNSSIIRFGHFAPQFAELEYQGQEYDWIFIDEATQFSEREFRILGACLRGVNNFPKKMFLTCNPGGIGHAWVKRLFIDKIYSHFENPDDYSFIPATVDDNSHLLRASPDYLNMLDALPDDIRMAHRFGDWNALSGSFFPEFNPSVHVVPSFSPPAHWRIYRAFDYGLDMFACLWFAIDPNSSSVYAFREAHSPGLLASQAAELIIALSPFSEAVSATIAPFDMWNSQKDSGKSIADIFLEAGVPLTKVAPKRVQSLMMLKELLRPPDNSSRSPRLLICDSCSNLIRFLPLLQTSKDNPMDCSTYPHHITHICDALRYFAAFRFSSLPYLNDPPDPYDDSYLRFMLS